MTNSLRQKHVRTANGSLPMVSIAAQSAANTIGSTIDMGAARLNHALFVVSGAGVSAGVITLLGSNDGVNFITTATTVTVSAANTPYQAVLTNTPYRYLAAKITTVITGGTVTATISSC